MPDPHDIDEQRLEEIVAYLDGELSAEDSARVERRLASDEAYRQQLQGVERAWQALDELPLTTVDDRFSRTTMEMAVLAAQAEVAAKTVALPVVRRRMRLSSLLAAIAAAALGFLVVRLAWRQPDRLLVADLPVVDNVDVYSQFQRPDFLRSLRDEFGDKLSELAGKSVDLELQAARFRAVSHPDDRRRWLSRLDDAERTNLRAKYFRFRELPPAEQQRLRTLHEAIVAAPDAPQLERTMLAYHAWLSRLTPAQQFELRATDDIPQRIRMVRRWADQMQEDDLLALGEEELRRLAARLRQPLDEFRQALGQRPREGRPAGPADQPPRRMPYGGAWLLAAENSRSAKKLEAAVLEALPQRVRQPFQQLSPPQKFQQLATWMRQAEALARGRVSQQELERYFSEELDVETREYLLRLPAEQMQQALEWRYRRQTGLGFDGPRRGDGAWPGDRPGPPGEHRDGRPRGPGGRGGPGPRFGPPEPRPHGQLGPPDDSDRAPPRPPDNQPPADADHPPA
ncbi:MAG: hypothetical protein IT424_08180 [Pirellulales bacterium]|nr:hypothetical protein [Pirellulales bacterium]